MNEKEFKVLFEIYKSKSIYLREIVAKTKLAYGTVQKIIERKKDILNIKSEGKNKYYSLKETTQNNYLIQQLEIENTKQFIKNNIKLKPFIDKILELKIPILIFGSYAKNTQTKNSDIDILTILQTKANLPNHLVQTNIHNINIEPSKMQQLKNETLLKEILDNHIIIYGFDTFLNEVFK